MSKTANNARELLLDKAQNDFLFKHLLPRCPSTASVSPRSAMMSDSTGKVLECAASLDPHALRPAEFKQDDTLLASLVQRAVGHEPEHHAGL